MPKWTPEQESAIINSGTNIIVSAGAGSGKTAVLTARVIHKLEKVHMNELLILTFTKAAAGEMKERIRSSLKKNPKLKEELKLIDSSYITTFDSFSLSIVKKYHYLLNLTSSPEIADESLINIVRMDTLRETLDYFYEIEDQNFLNFIKKFCVKNDEDVYNCLLTIVKKLESEYEIEELLTFWENILNTEKTSEWIQEFKNLVDNKRNELKENLEDLSFISKEYYDKCLTILDTFLNVQSYDDLILYKSIKLPVLPKNSEDDLKSAKESISNTLKEIVKLLEYGNTEKLQNDLSKMQDNSFVLIKIIRKFFIEFSKEKKEQQLFNFNDIAFLSLKILKEFPRVREEVKNQFKEIMVDEYQDTNNIQEEFISLISNQNVYMVGDIKQSIYRFRNANPYIFKSKYDQYRNHENGEKIDLLKNFRSREEVLKNINLIFNQIMDNDIGGADYINEHQMIFGNLLYQTVGDTGQKNDLDVITYETSIEFTKEEIEIFTIAKDIQEKIQNKYLVFDKNLEIKRPCEYHDFVILMDRTTNFDLYKKIFNYFQIPLSLYKDETLSNSFLFGILTNLLKVLLGYYEKTFDVEFKFAYVSIERSFLREKEDNIIYKEFQEKNWFQSDLYVLLKPILKTITESSVPNLLEKLFESFNFYEKLIKIGNLEENILIIENFMNLAKNYSQKGYHLKEFYNFLKRVSEEEIQIKYTPTEIEVDSVKIMTIHKSKGLEFPICYFSGLYKSFNIADLKDRFLYDTKYGFITPLMEEGIYHTFLKELVKNNYLKEEISEKLRLFYVALTRAKEKIILLLPNSNKILNLKKKEGCISISERLKVRSFADFLYSIFPLIKEFQKKIDLSTLNLTKNYLYLKKTKKEESTSTEKLQVDELSIPKEEIDEKKYSKESSFITKEDYKNMQIGIKMHEYLEMINFQNPNDSKIENDYYKNKIKKFINHPLIQNNLNGNFYKEYEFIYDQNEKEYHGVIDLLIENESLILIDYKLKNTIDDAYQKQLIGYYNFLKQKSSKKIEIYLYSILDETFINVKLDD